MRPLQGVAGMVTLVFLIASAHAAAPAPAPVGGQNPLASLVRSAPGEGPLQGVVEERISAGSYAYLRLRTAQGGSWTVTMGRGAEVGARVRVRRLGHSASFYSKRLSQTFPDLVFGVVSTIEEE